MSKFIKALIISDFLLYFSYGLLTPIMAIFVIDQIDGGTLEVVGLATAIYWIVRSLTTLPLARFMDKREGEGDEFYFMVGGGFFMSLTLMALIFASLPWHLYLIQALFGVFNSMAIPGWRVLFTNHLDRRATGFEWSLWDVAVALATAASAYAGSLIADWYGFKTLFVLVGLVGVLGAIVLLPLRKHVRTMAELKRLHRDYNESVETAMMEKT